MSVVSISSSNLSYFTKIVYHINLFDMLHQIVHGCLKKQFQASHLSLFIIWKYFFILDYCVARCSTHDKEDQTVAKHRLPRRRPQNRFSWHGTTRLKKPFVSTTQIICFINLMYQIRGLDHQDIHQTFPLGLLVCLFVYFALIQSTFRLFKGQQYLNNMLRINKQ